MNKSIIPAYIINLENRTDRKEYILKEFAGHNEFDVHIVKAHEHKIGSVGLWSTIMHIIKDLVSPDAEYILICEDDHHFTEHYDTAHLYNCILEAQKKDADVLLGGLSSIRCALPVSESLCWTHSFSGLQFTIIFKKFFGTLLNSSFDHTDAADYKIAALTTNKFFIYPFISIQKEFGYSDATPMNNQEGRVTSLFNDTGRLIQQLMNVRTHYKTNIVSINGMEAFDNMVIPTYVLINADRPDNLKHIENQFKGRDEFDVTFINTLKKKSGKPDVWRTIRKIIRLAIKNEDDVIIISEDGHEFTKNYTKEYLLKNIIESHQQGINILSGGICNHFSHIVPVAENRFWVSHFFGMQFIIIYRHFFKQILAEPYNKKESPDLFLSNLTSSKMVLHPHISIKNTPISNNITNQATSDNTLDIYVNNINEYYLTVKRLFENSADL